MANEDGGGAPGGSSSTKAGRKRPLDKEGARAFLARDGLRLYRRLVRTYIRGWMVVLVFVR